MCFPKLSFYYRQIESTDILIHVFLLKLQGGKKKELETCVTICYHKWRNSLFSALCILGD